MKDSIIKLLRILPGKMPHTATFIGRRVSNAMAQVAVAIAIIELMIIPGLPTRFGATHAFLFPSPDMSFCETKQQNEQKSQECTHAKVAKRAAETEEISFLAYTTASIVCAASCSGIWSVVTGYACTVATVGAAGWSIAGGFAFATFAEEHEKILGQIYQNWLHDAGAVVSLAQILVNTVPQVADFAAKALATTAESAAKGAATESKKAAESTACWIGVAFNIAETVVTGINAGKDLGDAAKFLANAQGQLGDPSQNISPNSTFSSSGNRSSNASAPEMPGNPNLTLAAKKPDPKGVDAAIKAASAAGLGPTFDQFQKAFGKSANDVLKDMFANNKSPMQVAAELTKDAGGDAKSMQLAQEAGEALAKHPDALAKARDVYKGYSGFDTMFASTGSGNRAPASKSSTGNINFGNLFGAKASGAKQGGPAALTFGIKAPVFDAEGFYPASVSLFDVIGGRYTSLAAHVDAGENVLGAERGVVRLPATDTSQRAPDNPYLGR